MVKWRVPTIFANSGGTKAKNTLALKRSTKEFSPSSRYPDEFLEGEKMIKIS
jgi:hypothetical protein